jgi:hypothetical protein
MTTAFSKDIGKHCAVTTCHQLDFLPTKCDDCLSFHCSEHSDAASHDCKSIANKEKRAVECATCHQLMAPSELNGHRCADSAVSVSSKKSKICSVPKCKSAGEIARLSATKCKHCSEPLCIEHRFDCECRKKKSFLSRQTGTDVQTKRALMLDAATRRAQTQQHIETR